MDIIKKEGGNSFIGDLMAELRDLPKQAATGVKKEEIK